jgi:hypothetical protein
VLPFDILHQTVLVVLGFFLLDWRVPVAVKYPVLLGLSLTIILAIYTCLVRPWRGMRFLFGMNPAR